MKLEVLCQVTKLEACERYQNKPGSTDLDYSKPKLPYTKSTLTILDNDKGLEGYFMIDQQLRFGQILSLVLDTSEEIQVVKEIPVSAAAPSSLA